MNRLRLGDLLVSAGLITPAQLDQALARQQDTKERLGEALINSGVITEAQLIQALEMQLGIEFVDLSRLTIPTELARLLPRNLARRHNIVPVKLENDTLTLAMSDPLNYIAFEDAKTTTRKRVIPVIASASAIDRAIMTLYGSEGAARAIEEMKREAGGEVTFEESTADIDDPQAAPTIRLVNSIIQRAFSERASDIHLEPRKEELRVRMRIDGIMRNVLTVPRRLQASVISRFKIMASMDIAERKVPQDGRANVRVNQSEIDLRLSTIPAVYGENMVIRLLVKDSGLLQREALGLSPRDQKKYDALLHNAAGVVLMAGPTGSGKSSTMYTMMQELNQESVNLITLEDPVEYDIDGITQVQINEKTGMTFASGLRAILRQDPDIIAVGEIRDGETAQIAMRAAITGHLVLSTIHTSNSLSTLDRLTDIDVPPYLIGGALKGVISQRLIRKICPNCRTQYAPGREEAEKAGLHWTPALRLYRGEGCPDCFHTGYRGRTGVFEILIVDRPMASAIARKRPREELERLLHQGDFTPLEESCRQLVLDGITTAEEAIRTIASTDI